VIVRNHKPRVLVVVAHFDDVEVRNRLIVIALSKIDAAAVYVGISKRTSGQLAFGNDLAAYRYDPFRGSVGRGVTIFCECGQLGCPN
jgi:hypothetical protein